MKSELRNFAFVAALSLGSLSGLHADRPFVDTLAPSRFVNVGVHASVGNSTLTQNYRSSFPQISQLNVSAGWSFGAGANVEFGLRDFMWLGTEANLLIDNNSIDMIVNEDQSATSVSNIFLRNHYYYLNIPVYMSFKFNLAPTVRWNIDGGIYYSYGLGGNQRQNVYSSRVNEIGQLVATKYEIKTDYFNDSRSFINSYHRGDIGLHLATGLTFGSRISVGARMQFGFKNVANTVGVTHPNIHNLSFTGTLGYWF